MKPAVGEEIEFFIAESDPETPWIEGYWDRAKCVAVDDTAVTVEDIHRHMRYLAIADEGKPLGWRVCNRSS